MQELPVNNHSAKYQVRFAQIPVLSSKSRIRYSS